MNERACIFLYEGSFIISFFSYLEIFTCDCSNTIFIWNNISRLYRSLSIIHRVEATYSPSITVQFTYELPHHHQETHIENFWFEWVCVLIFLSFFFTVLSEQLFKVLNRIMSEYVIFTSHTIIKILLICDLCSFLHLNLQYLCWLPWFLPSFPSLFSGRLTAIFLWQIQHKTNQTPLVQ